MSSKKLPDQGKGPSAGNRLEDAWERAIIAHFQCSSANTERFSAPRLHQGKRSRKDVVAGSITPWNQDVAGFLWGIFNDVLVTRDAVIAGVRAKQAKVVAKEVRAALELVPIEEWLTVPGSKVPSDRRAAVQQAAHRGKIRSAVSTRDAKNVRLYSMSDLLGTSHEGWVRPLQAKAAAEWTKLSKATSLRGDHPLALPRLLQGLARRLELVALVAAETQLLKSGGKRSLRKTDKTPRKADNRLRKADS